MRLSSLLLLSLALIIQYIKSNELRDSNNAADDPKSYDPSKIELVEENLEKSVLDDYQYRVIKLPNGVEVALASDPNALISSVTAAVRVGNKNDPKDFPGMAHLCEHLLFMGTKKYPKENEHVAYAMERGGNFNAFTALGRTVYMSEIHPKYQYQQLDRLAQFFIEPLFREEIIELETHSINSEFEMYFTQTLKARFQLFNHALSHTGKFPVFTTGNRQTLFSEPRARNASTKQALQDFFNKHYVSRNIKVAVCGNESLDVLQEWVATTFGRIPDRGPTDIQDTDPFADMPSYHFTYYNPFVSNLLTLAFMVPSMGVHYKSTPMHYLDYVFSYLGSDAPLYRLAIRDLASDIDIIVVPYSDNYDIVLVSFDLLDYGRAMPVEVIIEFFRCLQFFKEYGVNKDVFEDIMNAQRGQFKYSPKKSPPGVTEALALNLLHENLPRKHLLNKQIIKEYDEDEFNELFSALQPDKFVSFINLPGKTYNLTEPYYNVTYQRALHKETLIELLKRVKAPTKVQFPPKNIYITINSPITMEKLNSTVIKPDILRTTSISTLWYKYGSYFYCPFGVIRVLLRNPFVNLTPTNIYKLKFLQLYLYTTATIEVFFTTMAGLYFDIITTSQGLVLYFYGYGARIMEIFTKIMTLFEHLSFPFDKFERLNSIIFSGAQQKFGMQPSYFVKTELEDILASETLSIADTIILSEQFEHPDINAFFYDFLNNLHFDILVTGNIPPQDALHILYLLEALFTPNPLMSSQYTGPRALTLQEGSNYFRVQRMPRRERRSAALVYFEGTHTSNLRRKKLLFIIYLILREPLFHELRTKEQLGYVIESDIIASKTILGYYIIVQTERQPHVVHSRIDVFFDNMYKRLLNMSSEDLIPYLEGLDILYYSEPLDIVEETSSIWTNIVDGTYSFQYRGKSTNARPIELREVIQLYEELFYSRKRKISYHSFSTIGADIYNVFDLPLGTLSEYFTTKGQDVSKEQLRELVLLSHDIPSFQTRLFEHLLTKNKDNSTVNSMLNDAFSYLRSLYKLEKEEIIKPLDLIKDLGIFKANATLSSSYVNRALWSKFYK